MQLFKKRRDNKLINAVTNDDCESLEKLLKSYTTEELSQPFNDGASLISLAIENGSAKALQRMVIAGVKADYATDGATGEQLLISALESTERLSLLKSLSNAGANLKQHQQLLIENGLKHCTDNELMLFLTLLIQQGIDIDTSGSDGRNSMDYALEKQDLALINFLIGSGSKEREYWPEETPNELVQHIKRRYADLKIQAAFLNR